MPKQLIKENIQEYKEEHLEELQSIKQFKRWFETVENADEKEISIIIGGIISDIVY